MLEVRLLNDYADSFTSCSTARVLAFVEMRRRQPGPRRAGKASPEGEGNWSRSSFADLVQYNDGFKTNLMVRELEARQVAEAA